MREKMKNTPFLKKSPGEKSNTPLFLQFSGRTLSHEKYPFTGHFGNTHAVIPTSEWGGRGEHPATIVLVRLFSYQSTFSSLQCEHPASIRLNKELSDRKGRYGEA